ncbi:MAG: hypothetical protein KF868_19735 [Acidobacteria bacterium]|nr:hypothetical protein [Acidobacteriota bacterium]MCW5968850.1 hypothetical protein [Blastocatellales bacterium]
MQPVDEVFLDANIFVYFYLGSSQQCRLLLDQCRQGILHGHTAAFVFAEIVHRLKMIEGVEQQLATPGRVVKKLRENPDIVKQLSKYSAAIPQIKAMKIEIAPLNLTILGSRLNQLNLMLLAPVQLRFVIGNFKPLLFGAQRNHRINLRRTSRRKVTSQQRGAH